MSPLYTADACISRLHTAIDAGSAESEKYWLTPLFDRNFFMRTRCIADSSVEGQRGAASLRGRFGNLPFSSAILCNHHPLKVQQLQEQNFSLPLWAAQPVSGTFTSNDPFDRILADLTRQCRSCTEVQEITGTHALLAALDTQEAFDRAPPLSQYTARLVHSIQPAKSCTTFTQYALMHWYWSIWRWMLDPGPNSYYEMPAHGRPTPYQLFFPHPHVFEFLAQPNLRDLMCQKENPDVRWLSEGAATIQCEWLRSLDEAFSVNPTTGEIELSLAAKVSRNKNVDKLFSKCMQEHIERPGVWSFGPTIRLYLQNADLHLTVR